MLFRKVEFPSRFRRRVEVASQTASPMAKAGKDDAESDDEGELNAREYDRIEIHGPPHVSNGARPDRIRTSVGSWAA
jgi:hypothetical protein